MSLVRHCGEAGASVPLWLSDHGRGLVAGPLEVADLLRLAVLAAEAGVELFERRPRGSGCYAGRLLGMGLCQGISARG